MNKNRIVLGVTLLLFVSVLIETIVIFITYQARKESIYDIPIITNSSISLIVSFNDKNTIEVDKIYNGWTDTLEFEVKNNTNYNVLGTYKINLEVIDGIFVNEKNDFLYDLICTSDSKTALLNVLPSKYSTRVPNSTISIGTGKISSGVIHSCKLTFKFNGDDTFYKDESFIGKVNINSVME